MAANSEHEDFNQSRHDGANPWTRRDHDAHEKNDPADVPRSITLARRVRGKIKQNCSGRLSTIPIAAGALYPWLGVLLRPEWAALAMSASTVTVTINALLLNRVRFGDAVHGVT